MTDFTTDELDENVCITNGCIKAAADILDNLDQTVDPCNNFYQFACGGYAKKHIGDTTVTPSVYITYLNQMKTINALLNPLQTDPPEVRKAQDYFKSCLNADFEQEMESFIEEVQKLRMWPILDYNFDESEFNWLHWHEGILAFPFDRADIIMVRVKQPDDLAEKPVLTIALPMYVSGDESDTEPEKIYIDYLRKFHINVTAEHIETIKEALQLSLLLKNITMQCFQDDEDREEQVTVSQLYDYAEINWMQYLSNYFSVVDVSVGLLTPVNITNCTLENLSKVVAILEETPERTIATFMLLKIMQSGIEDLKNLLLDYSDRISSVAQKKIERLTKCNSLAVQLFAVQLLKLFESRHFGQNNKKFMLEITSKISETFRPYLKYSPWIDHDSLKILLNKYDARTMKLYLDDYVYQQINAHMEKNININDKTYVKNNIQAWKSLKLLSLAELEDPLKLYSEYRRYIMLASHGPAYFLDNEIIVGSMMHKALYFDEDIPMSIRYGAVGLVIGHELIHGVSSYIIDHDAFPMINFSEEFLNKFNTNVKCIIDKHNGIILRDVRFRANGTNTLAEDLSDLEGARAAFFAYQKHEGRTNFAMKLPGLKFTGNQLFWMAAANLFCHADNKFIFHSMSDESHSHLRVRVLSIVSNSPEFSHDFHCSKDTPMNSKEKCFVWMPESLD